MKFFFDMEYLHWVRWLWYLNQEEYQSLQFRQH